MKIAVIGSGVIGATTAFRLAELGADVAIIEAAQPAQAASGASFGWINASFYENDDHFRLRFAAIAAHRRLAADLASKAISWPGCLCWEEEGTAFETQYRTLKDLGYSVRKLSSREFAHLEPAIPPPAQALHFAQEGVVDLVKLTHDALRAAIALGARLITGTPVLDIETTAGQVSGCRVHGGSIAVDRVVLATGTSTPRIMERLGIPVPMLDRQGAILRSRPVPAMMSHVLVSPGQEIRQDATGRILAPTTAAHQSDATDHILTDPRELAEDTIERLNDILGCALDWEGLSFAYRPVPQDGLPVLGACGPEGLYVSTMHSGATLAALASEIAAAEVLDIPLSNTQASLITPYRPQRFAS